MRRSWVGARFCWRGAVRIRARTMYIKTHVYTETARVLWRCGVGPVQRVGH